MMQLKTLYTVKRNSIGEIRVCEDIGGKNSNRYTVWVISDHEKVKSLLTEYDKVSDYIKEPNYVDMFSDQGKFFIVFPYVPERPLEKFYMGNTLTLRQCEEICMNLIIACMTSNMPWSILYLVLKQRQIHLSKDGSIALSVAIDLEEYDETADEGACTLECAKILLEMLEPKANKKANSYILLTKKVEKSTYYHFTELYKDVKAAMVPVKKGGILLRLKVFVMRNKDEIFTALLRISIVLAIFVILTFLTNLIFGDVPWLRVFIKSFEHIGLEDLRQ